MRMIDAAAGRMKHEVDMRKNLRQFGPMLALSGAAGSMSAGMNGQSASGTMAVGSRAGSDARRLGAGAGGGSGEMSEMGGGSGYPGSSSGGGGGYPSSGGGGGYPGASGGDPSIPNPSGGGAAVAAPRKNPLRWSKETGEDFLRELIRTPTRGRSSGSRVGMGGARLSEKRLARLPKGTRTRIIAGKYKKPPVGYLASYLPQDRYKLTSGLWKFVSIEDDRGRYPVKYYYRPDSPVFLSLLGRQPRGSQPRYNRVLGFDSWQNAIIAGYRPDPISKPAPGAQLAVLNGISPREELARYTEFVYAGQVTPRAFAKNYRYILQVRDIAYRRKDTRQLLRPTVGQILLAALGEGPLPTQIGVSRAIVTTQIVGGGGGYPGSSGSGYPSSGGSGYPGSGGYPGSSGGYPGGSPSGDAPDKREQDYNNFSNRAGKLSSTR